MQISLRAGGRLYLNGAVIRADRKVNIELLNDATFLMEAHVLQVEHADTPLKQLYFVIQALLIDPRSEASMRPILHDMLVSLTRSFANRDILAGLEAIRTQLDAGRHFDALKALRALYPAEAAIIAGPAAVETAA